MRLNGLSPLRPERRQLLMLATLVFLLLVLKSPDALVNPQFWAEDGVIFFAEQFDRVWPQLFTPYAGYWHFIPRLVAWFAAAFSYPYMPLVYNLFAVGIDAAAVCYFTWRTRFLVPVWLSLAVFALVPTDGEIFGTLTNVQWFTQFALFALALYPRCTTESASSRWPTWVVALLLALTGPFSIFITAIVLAAYLPARLERRPGQAWSPALRSWLGSLDCGILATIMLGGALQLSVLLLSTRHSQGPFNARLTWDVLIASFQMHTFGDVLLKSGLFVCFIGVLGFALLDAPKRCPYSVWPIFLAMCAFGLVQIFASAQITPDAHLLSMSFYGDRYFVFAKIAFWIWLASSVGRLGPESPGELVIVLLLGLIALRHPGYLQRKPLPDLHWKQSVSPLEHPPSAKSIVIPINPVPWRIVLRPPSDTRT